MENAIIFVLIDINIKLNYIRENLKVHSLQLFENFSNTKPLLKWPGGKTQLLPLLVPHFLSKYMLKKDNKYIEPFAGGCAVAFYINFHHMVLNDKNHKLINFLLQIRENFDELHKKILSLKREMKCSKEKEEFYFEIRTRYNDNDLYNENKLENAALLWFLNKTGFNGIYRENSKGKLNVSYGQRECPLPPYGDFLQVSETLKKCELISVSFEDVCEKADKDDIVYLDPPYIEISETSSFSKYFKDGFSIEDHHLLCKTMNELSTRGTYVVMSNSCCEKTYETYKSLENFEFVEIEANRMIAGDGDARKKVKELIISNRKYYNAMANKTS